VSEINERRADMRKRRPTVLLTVIAFVFLVLTPADAEKGSMKIGIRFNGNEIRATLIDSVTSRDFVSLLPLKLKLEDYGDVEKIGYLPRKLSTEGAPPGSDPSAGDVSYYAPWGNVAIFHRDFRYSSGLIKLGTVDTGVEALNVSGTAEVAIDLVR
jgi:hypothetical protein